MRALLGQYLARVRRHPALTLCMFADPQLFTASLAAFSERLLAEVRCFDTEPELLFELLVDYCHGHALALALAGDSGQGLEGAFDKGLHRLLR